MSICSTTLLILHLVMSAFIMSMLATASTVGRDEFSWMSKQLGGGGCTGSIAECMGDAAEMEMESESTRRILATTDHISYDALDANNVPCSQRGASYYNCRSGGQANPYQRGCSTITRCQR
uniref:rapid alkalinization factor-like n=1 Tax=Erigeron canadensis TaxID=72917 RepID=UPI001CB8D054|nr:rapid alkalinization factor-like [Erigeron canadensis]